MNNFKYLVKQLIHKTSTSTSSTCAKYIYGTAFTLTAMMSLKQKQLAECQGALKDFVTNINDQSSVKYLLSQLRDKNTKTAEFRSYSDRIMRLLLE